MSVVAAGALLVAGERLGNGHLQQPIPQNFQAFAAATPGCITSDDATTSCRPIR